LRYLREKERLDPASSTESKGDVTEESAESGVGEKGKGKKQKVYVLKGGFTMWQEKYGEDKNLTEGYEKDIWEFGAPEN
jgi:Cdc25 family phosphatase